MKQQKRRTKAAISVQDLHGLQDQARPGDSFLFYWDVEEKIEHATAAKLERFIAMTTRPIYNSVSKWANWATSKVKSIIEWIKPRGNNNRAALERLEKRYIVHFQHRAQETTIEKKEGTVHYIPQ